MSDAAIADAFERQAEACRLMGSSFYAALMSDAGQACRTDARLQAMLMPYERTRFFPLRFAATLHRWALDGSAPQLASHFPSTGGDGDAHAAWLVSQQLLHERGERFAGGMRDVPQTNEVARAMPLMAGLLLAAHRLRRPLRIFEIGASAGLNLRFDAYAYRGAEWRWGSAGASLVLSNRAAAGAPAHTGVRPQVLERRGCDLLPLDCGNAADRERLLSFVWPDQRERIGRLERAMSIARKNPVRVDRADAVEWLADVARPERDALTVVVHSVVTEHLSDAARAALDEQIEALASASSTVGPLARLSMERGPDAYETRLRLWPLGEEWLVARSDGHAQSLHWCNAQA